MSKTNGLWNIVNKMNSNSDNALFRLINSYKSPNDAAEAMSSTFFQYFSLDPSWQDVLNSIEAIPSSIDWNPVIEVHAVQQLLMKLKAKKSPGSDGLPPRLLSLISEEIAGPLAHLIALSIETSTVPKLWKIANIKAVPKSRPARLDNLRAISLLPAFSKILETVVVDSLKADLIRSYGSNQFGFRPRTSTTHAHIHFHDFLTRMLDRPDCIACAVISFDMNKAFDRLLHSELIHSLHQANLPLHFIKWCISFLKDRQQRVRIDFSTCSTLRIASSGVPQGSVIAPYLFCVHMASLQPASPTAQMTKYADDVLCVIPIVNANEVQHQVNHEISNVHQWCRTHGLITNDKKTKLMYVKKGNVVQYLPTDIEVVENLKVLGVIYSSDLRWNSHVDMICRKAYQRIFVLKRLKSNLPRACLLSVYNAFILSALEYCSPVFVGVNDVNKEKIEKVRRRCHRIICGCDCQCSSFTPLWIRRNNRALVFLKQIENENDIIHCLHPRRFQRSQQLEMPTIFTKRRHNSFVPFVTSLANHSA